jgi:lysophospholipase L1-like esterase
MRPYKLSSYRLLCALVLVLALSLGVSTAAVAQGSVDFSRYVALGDSLGAGFMSGGLVDDVQAHSYPALIYQQTGGAPGGFAQPTVSPPGIPSVLQLAGLSPLRIVPGAGGGFPTNALFPAPYNNLAVPGADINDILNTRSGGLNDLILRGLGTQLELALAQQPTFATVWVNNDALGAAVSGIVLDGLTLTTAASFEANFRAVTQTLAGAGVDLALGTVVNPVTIPFVTTLPPILIDANNQPVIINGAIVPLLGPEGPLVLGQDFVLLTASAELAVGRGLPPQFGGTGPLSDHVVLSAAEVATISARVEQFNAVIRAVATELGAALFDAKALLVKTATEGIVVGGIEYSHDFVTGGIFSLDGVHGTAFGYAFLANSWIGAINEAYGSEVPLVNLSPYVFGPFAGAGTGYPLVAPTPGNFVFTPKADKQMRSALSIPSRARLARVKARRQAAANH